MVERCDESFTFPRGCPLQNLACCIDAAAVDSRPAEVFGLEWKEFCITNFSSSWRLYVSIQAGHWGLHLSLHLPILKCCQSSSPLLQDIWVLHCWAPLFRFLAKDSPHRPKPATHPFLNFITRTSKVTPSICPVVSSTLLAKTLSPDIIECFPSKSVVVIQA